MTVSKLWQSLTANQFADVDLAHFREPEQPNNRLAVWNPMERSSRYFKFLFFAMMQTKQETFWKRYAKLGNTTLGNPPTVNGINLDHFLAIEEYEFVARGINQVEDLSTVHSILEIGAGFGRTAQAWLTCYPALTQYTILDLPAMLAVSRRYLREVLSSDQFAKVAFVTPNVMPLPHDLVINIDSFQEMTPETIRGYLNYPIAQARYFYSKNTVGKYRPESVGLTADPQKLLDVFELGLSRQVVDIFNPAELESARRQHVLDYQPSGFDVVTTEPLGIFPYYQHVLYRKHS